MSIALYNSVYSPKTKRSSIQITLVTYSHVPPGLQQVAAARFDELLNRKPNNEVIEKVG